MESNPSLTLVAVTLTSLAVTILSAASSRVSVRVAASERSSAIDAVVALWELLGLNSDVGDSVSGDKKELVGSGDFVLALVVICSFSIMLISGAVDPVMGLAEIVVLGLSSVIVSIDEYVSETVDPLEEDPIVEPCVVDLLRLVESEAIVELEELVDFLEVVDPENIYWLLVEGSVASLGVDGSVLVGLWVVS